MKFPVIALALLATQALAEPAAVGRTRTAMEALQEAEAALTAAPTASDQIAALTKATRAEELALAALRAGLRDIEKSQLELTGLLTSDQAALSRLIRALNALSQVQQAGTYLHPAGARARIDAALILDAITPEIAARAAALKTALDDTTVLREAHQSAADALKGGLVRLRWAQGELVAKLDKQAAESPPQTSPALTEVLESLASSSRTLDVLVQGLAALDPPQVPLRQGEVALDFGRLPLPALGTLVSNFGVIDPRSGPQTGATLVTTPGTLVMAPFDATIRYVGPFLGYGNVIILEPSPDILLVLAGMEKVYGRTDSIVHLGDVIGQVGETQSGNSSTIYLEIRRGGSPVDPAGWFATKGN